MAHESTVDHANDLFGPINGNRQNSLVKIAEQHGKVQQGGVPHLFAETPKAVTHHHDTDDDDTDHSDTN